MTKIRPYFSKFHRLPPDGGLPKGGTGLGVSHRNASKCECRLGESLKLKLEQHRELVKAVGESEPAKPSSFSRSIGLLKEGFALVAECVDSIGERADIQHSEWSLELHSQRARVGSSGSGG